MHQMIRKYSYIVPLIYFTLVVIWMYFGSLSNAQESEPLVLLFCLPFLFQIGFKNRMGSVILGMLMLVWSGWMALAYASEYAQATHFASVKDMSFLAYGVGLVLLNFVMSLWLFPAEMGKATQEQQYQL